MIKREELKNPNSCMNKAQDGEMVFVLLARDVTAPDVIRYWVEKRLALGKNKRGDEQTQKAFDCARRMEYQQRFPSDMTAPVAAVGGDQPTEEKN